MRVTTLLLAAVATLSLAACSSSSRNPGTPTAIAVQTAMPVRQTFHARIAAFGQLAADTRGSLSLSLPQAGQVVATEVLAGQRVKRGEPLLKLATDPTARSAWLQARSAVAVARDDLTRTERLHAGKLATNTQVDAARKALADAKSTLAAQAKLGGAQAIATLRAPADGVVTTLDVQRGQRITAGTKLLAFAPQAALVAQLGVDPGAAATIHPGMSVALHPVYAAHGTPPLAATIAMVGAAIDPATHLVVVVATLDKAAALPAGTALSATIEASKFRAWAVPRNALQSDAHGSYVFQIEQGKARRVDVQVLAPNGSPVGVTGPIESNAPVITLGSYEISDGDAVQAAASATPRQRGAAA